MKSADHSTGMWRRGETVLVSWLWCLTAPMLARGSESLSPSASSNSANPSISLPVQRDDPTARSLAARYRFHVLKTEHGLPQNTVECLLQTRDGYLWIGTRFGLARFDGVRFTVFDQANTPAFKTDTCIALAEDADGNLWAATKNGLLRWRDPRFTRFTVENGLNVDQVWVLCGSQRGGMWIGTEKGLSHFTQSLFENSLSGHREAGSFANLHAGSVRYRRSAGILPAGSGGILPPVPSFQTGSQEKFSAVGETVLAGARVYSLAEDAEGNLWIGWYRGIARLPNGAGSVEEILRTDVLWPLAHQVLAIHPEPGGAIWFGTGHGLHVLQNGKVTTFTPPAGPTGQAVISIFKDLDGRLWVIAGNGLCQIAGTNFIPLRAEAGLSDDYVKCIRQDHEGSLWIGTLSGGLNQLMPRRLVPYSAKDGLPHDFVWSISEAHDGSLWIATEGGASQFKEGVFTTFRGPANYPYPPPTSLRSILHDRAGNTWLGAAESGVNVFREGVAHHLHFYSTPTQLPGRQVHALYEDRQTNVWVGTDGGLTLIQQMHFVGPFTNFVNYTTADGLSANDVRAILEDRTGDLWIGTKGGGVNWFHDGQFTAFTSQDGLAHDNAWAFHEDADGVLWVGTEHGLSRLSPTLSSTGGHPFSAGSAGDPPAPGVAASRESAALSFGNQGAPLSRDAATGARFIGRSRIFSFTTRHGLFDNLVNHILEDDFGHFWISCNQGIYRVNRRALNDVAEGRAQRVECVVYGEADGMLSSETNGENQPAGCKTCDGKLWFPTTKGVVVIDPAKATKNEVPPPVVIEQVLADDEIIYGDGAVLENPQSAIRNPQSEVASATTSRNTPHATRFSASTVQRFNEVTPRQPAAPPKSQITNRKSQLRLAPGRARVLEIHYTANSFLAPDKVRFKYRLEGHDPAWRDAGSRRTAIYTNLRPGDYIFRVQACNNHGVWNETGASFAFSLAPYFYQTRWFPAVCGVAILAAGYGLHRLRAYRQQQRAVALERARISRDIHDELGATLSRIALLSEGAGANTDVETTPSAPSPALADSAREARRQLDALVWAIDPEKNTSDPFADFVCAYAQSCFSGPSVRLHLDIPNPMPSRTLPPEVRQHLVLVLKEALTNIVRHAQATEVRITLRLRASTLTLHIADNGRGFDTAQLSTLNSQPALGGNGLANIRRRIAALHGAFDLTSQPNEGTRLTISVPL
ncbi:MAG: ATP-binding protein [Chloroflexi bacterium]|nr:ATP-binding protein [Chloroflexota bacterium]